MGSVNPYTWFVRDIDAEDNVNDIVVFGVGLLVSILVVFGIFSHVVVEMRDAKNQDIALEKGEDQQFSS